MPHTTRSTAGTTGVTGIGAGREPGWNRLGAAIVRMARAAAAMHAAEAAKRSVGGAGGRRLEVRA